MKKQNFKSVEIESEFDKKNVKKFQNQVKWKGGSKRKIFRNYKLDFEHTIFKVLCRHAFPVEYGRVLKSKEIEFQIWVQFTLKGVLFASRQFV